MSDDPYVVDVRGETAGLKPFTPNERAAYDAFQDSEAGKQTARDAARAAITWGNDPTNIADLAVVKQYVQTSRDYLQKPGRTQGDVIAQVDRNTHAILALLKRLV
jgi:hypothetical protein